MSSLTSIEKRQLEDAFGMSGGHVLDFTIHEFLHAVREATGLNIDDPRYAFESNSKAKRLRQFWLIESDTVVARLIQSFATYAATFQLVDSVKLETCRWIARRLDGVSEPVDIITKDHFLEQEYPEVCFDRLSLEPAFFAVMEHRWEEAKKCFQAGADLSVILLLGSLLEGILLGVAKANQREFNQATAAPKDDVGKVLPFWRWNLAALIDVAYGIGLLKLDVKKFSHGLREFRNYIHPYEQQASGFTPNQDTARICLQVFRAAVNQLSRKQ
jgi:hypothetical protein